jgi:hypothetical protein
MIKANCRDQKNGRGKMSELCMIEGVWESVKCGPFIHMKGWGLVGGINRWCMIC